MPSGKFAKDIVGERYSRLTVIARAPNKVYGSRHQLAMWECLCDCGGKVTVSGADLRNGHTKSCGCLQADRARASQTVHGNCKTKLNSIWSSMKQRCNNPNDKHYHRYGMRGITYCKEWESFKPFMEWAHRNGYQEGLTLDRIDNDGNYCPDNCRWLSRTDHAHKTWEDIKKARNCNNDII